MRDTRIDFIITEADLDLVSKEPPFIQISEGDIVRFLPEIVTVTLQDLSELEAKLIRITERDLPPIIQVSEADLPEIVRISMKDLPADLNNVSTDCYHGTSWEIAETIRREGFKVGPGAACGSGIYFSVGGMTIARGYLKSSRPCIIQARVNWGKVVYLDSPDTKAHYRGSGDGPSRAALKDGYNSFITTSKYSSSSPAIGIALGLYNELIRPPRIEVVDLIKP